MANIKIHVSFIVRKPKKSGAKVVTFYSCLFLSYTHLSHFLCCFWFNIFLLVMTVNDCQWAYEKFNAITLHFQLINKSFYLFLIMISLKCNLLANLLCKISTVLLLFSLFFGNDWNWLWPLYIKFHISSGRLTVQKVKVIVMKYFQNHNEELDYVLWSTINQLVLLF